MAEKMKKLLRFIGQALLLWVIFWIGGKIASLTGLPIPGNVIGVLLLFGLLLLGIVKVQHVQEAADFLLKHLVFFFIPIAVGLMNWGSVFYNYGIILAVALVIGALLPFWTVGFLTQWLHREEK
jgi:holin-like protein